MLPCGKLLIIELSIYKIHSKACKLIIQRCLCHVYQPVKTIQCMIIVLYYSNCVFIKTQWFDNRSRCVSMDRSYDDQLLV